MTRAGSHGEYEDRFFDDSCIYATWDELEVDLSKLAERNDLVEALRKIDPDAKPNKLKNHAAQLWPFAHDMQPGDLVVLPSKSNPVIHIGEIRGPYEFRGNGDGPYRHARKVEWLAEVPREHFGQDLRYSFGAFLTICRIHRANAEERVKAMQAAGWKPESAASVVASNGSRVADDQDVDSDIEQLGRDQIAKYISARFKGHELTRLVDAILRAKGYTTFVSPQGADGGADILAGTGPLGFAQPSLVVEVKSQEAPIDRPTVDKLLGAVTKFGAQHGLFVSWGDFKKNVRRELGSQFFNVRLWGRTELLEQLFENYDKLDEDLRAELPIKRVWTVAVADD